MKGLIETKLTGVWLTGVFGLVCFDYVWSRAQIKQEQSKADIGNSNLFISGFNSVWSGSVFISFVWFDSVWFRAQIKQEQSKADIGYVVARGGVVSYERGAPLCVR